jgi:hypothetical protein
MVLLNEPDLVAHTGLLLAEEEALKDYFAAITVPVRPGGTYIPVKTWFRYPEGERQIEYPFITIELLSIEPNYELFQSLHWYTPDSTLYWPSKNPDVTTVPFPVAPLVPPAILQDVPNYLPMTLVYQIGVYARSALHDKYLTSIFQTDILPPRPYWLWIPADETWRRMDLLSFAQSDVLETVESGTKRIFHKVYTLSLQAEIPQDYLRAAYEALEVIITLSDKETGDPLGTITVEPPPGP